jgi:hypothetical protein
MKCDYASYKVHHRVGASPILQMEIKIDFSGDSFEEGPFLVIPEYRVTLYEVSKDLRSRRPRGFIDYIIGPNVVVYDPKIPVKTHIEIPVSQELINIFNELRSQDKLPALEIEVNSDIIYYKDLKLQAIPRANIPVYKSVYGRTEGLVVFTSDEVDLLMRDLKYTDVIRVEIPFPLEAENIAQENIVKSVEELRAARELLIQGDYPNVLQTCRNIIMNYLTKRENRENLREDIIDYIISRAPESQRDLYEDVLKALGKTIHSLLQHLHKFVKEDTGKLMENPLRSDAEYAFYTLSTVLKYISELSTEK